MSDVGWSFVKGHGTGNDFVLLPDPAGSLDLTPWVVAAICDRRSGVGGDGVLRVVPTALVPPGTPGAAGSAAEWFMDYRNADGSVAEMCGNGVRVFAAYLVGNGLAARGAFAVGTRAGDRAVVVHPDGTVTVDMGPVTFPGPDAVRVEVDGAGSGAGATPPRSWPAVAVDVGNPHAVVFVDDLADAGPLDDAPHVSPADAFASGVNVEFAHVVAPGHVAMRVHERGVGETQSCGTGACAVFAAARRREGAGGGERWVVDVPGGRLTLVQNDAGTVELTGPAVLVAGGTLEPAWLDGLRP